MPLCELGYLPNPLTLYRTLLTRFPLRLRLVIRRVGNPRTDVTTGTRKDKTWRPAARLSYPIGSYASYTSPTPKYPKRSDSWCRTARRVARSARTTGACIAARASRKRTRGVRSTTSWWAAKNSALFSWKTSATWARPSYNPTRGATRNAAATRSGTRSR